MKGGILSQTVIKHICPKLNQENTSVYFTSNLYEPTEVKLS